MNDTMFDAFFNDPNSPYYIDNADDKKNKLPMQPLHITEKGTLRFVANRIVDDLYEFSVVRGFGMNEIARAAAQGKYTKEEQMQFAQLIGYSLSGYGSLSYVTDESYEEAEKFVEDNKLLSQ